MPIPEDMVAEMPEWEKRFDKKFCIDPARTFFGNPDKLKAEGWIVGGSGIMIKAEAEPKEIKDFIRSEITKARAEVLSEFVERVKERIPLKDEALWGVKGNFMIQRFEDLLTEQFEEAKKLI